MVSEQEISGARLSAGTAMEFWLMFSPHVVQACCAELQVRPTNVR